MLAGQREAGRGEVMCFFEDYSVNEAVSSGRQTLQIPPPGVDITNSACKREPQAFTEMSVHDVAFRIRTHEQCHAE